MFEPIDNGDSIELYIALIGITFLLGFIVFQLVGISHTLKAQPDEFIQKLQTELNP